jgi:hypothetical protein
MDFNKLFARVRAILLNPKDEWPVIADEPSTIKDLYLSYIMVLAAIGPIFGFIKTTLFGIDIPLMGTYRPGFASGLGNMLFSYAMALVGVAIMAVIINQLAPFFEGRKESLQALKTTAYAYTGAWIAGAGQLLPWLGLVLLLAGSLYSIYLLYLGLPTMMQCPTEKAKGYTAAAMVAAIVVGLIMSAVVGTMTGIGTMTENRSPGEKSRMDNPGFDKDSPAGKMEEWAKKMEAAGKDMEKAQQSGDAKQQSEAMGKMMATALGNDGPVETLTPEHMKTFLPEKLAGKTRSAVSAERSGAMGMQITTAEASYEDKEGNGLRLEITDMGLAKGLLALAGWVGIEKETVNESGSEKTYQKGSSFVHEQWDKRSSSGEYTIIVGGRFSVKVTGKATGISALKDAASSVNLDGLAALKDEKVKK